MAYELIQRPYLLYETAALLYHFVNGISCRSTLSLQLCNPQEAEWNSRRAEQLQQLLEKTCRGLNPEDPELTEFFGAVKSGDRQEATCLGYLLIFSCFTLKHPELSACLQAVRENWRLHREKGDWIESACGISLNFANGAGSPGDEFEQVCRLDFPAEFRISLCRALRDPEGTFDRLERLMEPVSRKLEHNLARVRWIWEEKCAYWNRESPLAYVSATVGRNVFPDENGQVLCAVFVMSPNCMLLKQSETDPERSYLYIGSCVSIHSQKRDLQTTCEMMSAALKAVSDRKRLEILCRLSRERAYSQELAEAMNIDPSNMSRSLSQLSGYGFLRQEREGQKNFYETDRAAVHNFFQQMEQFILG